MENSSRPDHSSEWNGGWFGAQIGGSAWMALGVVYMLVRREFALGAMMLMSCALVNVVGVYLWRNRRHLRQKAAIRFFLLVMALMTAIISVVWLRLDYMRPRDLWWLLILPVVYLQIEMNRPKESEPVSSHSPGDGSSRA